MDSSSLSSQSENARMRLLQAEIVLLKAELDRCRAELASPEKGDSVLTKKNRLIALRPLSLDHYLRVKWGLGHGLPDVSSISAQEIMAQLKTSAPHREGKLRIYGLLSNSFPWEAIIPLQEIVEKEGVFIGRDENLCSVVIPDAGISRRHALITLEDGNLYIADAGSTNGVTVNDTLLSGNMQHAPFGDGDTLALGETILRAELLQS